MDAINHNPRARHKLAAIGISLILLAATQVSQVNSGHQSDPNEAEQHGLVAESPADDVASAPNAAATYSFVPVAEGLAQPWFIAHPNDNRLFVVERKGKIRVIKDNALLPTPFLDLSNIVNSTGEEQGLISVAFEPNYAQNGRFYVLYTIANNDIVISRYKVTAGNPDTADPNSRQVVLTVPHPNNRLHNGGWMGFGKDGYLYITTGDGSGSKDTFCTAQNVQDLRGKLLRINVIEQNTYSSPPENAFSTAVGASGNNAKAAPEIFALGLRNPRRASFDRQSGDLYIGDVGEFLREEISLLPAGSKAGANFGWSKWEGSQAYTGNRCASTNLPLTKPILEYAATQNSRVIGGYVYRGEQMPALEGAYFYGDTGSGKIWAARRNNDGTFNNTLIADTNFTINTFGEGMDGELYVADYTTGNIYRISVAPTQYFMPMLMLDHTASGTATATVAATVAAPTPIITPSVTTSPTAIVTSTVRPSATVSGTRSAPTATPTPAPNVPTTNTTSRYMKTIGEQRHFDMGCVAGRNGESGLNVLAFGRAHQQNGEYGTVIYNASPGFASTAQIANAVKNFMRGYVNCVNRSSVTALRVAVGTSNFFRDSVGNFVTREHGVAWAMMVNEIGDWIKANPAIASRISVAGASDMEMPWNSAENTRAWMDGYASAYQYPIYNFGSCDSCPFNSRPNISPANGWTLNDILYVSWGAKPAFALPEIYLTNGINAEQWARLSLHSYINTGKPITYTGALTQWMACNDQRDPDCTVTGNSPPMGQRQLLAALNSDPRTAQRELKWNSDISWNETRSVLEFTFPTGVSASLPDVETVLGPIAPPSIAASDPIAVAMNESVAAKVTLEQAAEQQLQQARRSPPQLPSAVRVDGRGGGANDVVAQISNIERKTGGEGVIIEDGQAPLPGPVYKIANRWVWQKAGKTVAAYAGAKNPLNGDAIPLGVVVVAVEQEDSAGKVSERMQSYPFASAGQLRIVTEAGAKLIMQDEAGTQFELDLSGFTAVPVSYTHL
ncbi:MAG: PQQ-dependent sugar dehydrogenase, partial [Anaerolineae bacterium]|nr:PQQ-dependent sugar dehydrogenase [Anaerolineae bacterium]